MSFVIARWIVGVFTFISMVHLYWAAGGKLGSLAANPQLPGEFASGPRPAFKPSALGTFLVLGFTLHNITEGVGIAAPIIRTNPGLRHFVLLIMLAGGPAILGTWLGGFAFDPVLATIFLAIGIGAILQVVWEVGRLVVRRSVSAGLSAFSPVNLLGVAAGLALMYFTAFMVKF